MIVWPILTNIESPSKKTELLTPSIISSILIITTTKQLNSHSISLIIRYYRFHHTYTCFFCKLPMKYLICSIVLCLSWNLSAASSEKYPIQNFTPTDYKAGIQNIDFAQNRDMTLFVANNLGVLSYNGNEWRVHAFQSGKKVRSLAFDESTNRLYVGLQGAFGYLEDDWHYVSLDEKIPAAYRDFDEVWNVFLLDSKVYFCTFQGIYVYDGYSVVVIGRETRLNRSFLSNGRLFTQSPAGNLLEVKGSTVVASYPQNLTGRIIVSVIAHDQGYLLFYNSGEIEYTSSLGAVREYKKLADALLGKYVNHVMQLSDGRLAISTQTAGLFLFDLQNQAIENITRRDGLLTHACLNTFQDYSGNLWVGMQNGIALIDINAPMRFINQTINLQGSGYEAFEVEEGTYYTTSNGIYFLQKNATQCVFLPGTEGPAYGMQKIAGKLYAGHHTGLFLLERGRSRRIAFTDGLWQVKQLLSNPQYAIGGTYAGLYLFKLDKKKELQAVQKINGFEESSRFFEEDRAGKIWIGQFYKGLYRLSLSESLTEAEAVKVSKDYDAPLNEQLILSRIDNDLYLSTRAGIYKIDQTTGHVTEAEIFAKHIGKQIVYLLVQDHQKNIYVYAENLMGFYKQISANNYAFVPSSLHQLRYSFNNDLLNVSINTQQGVLFNANEGFIHYIPALEARVDTEQPLVISQVSSVTERKAFFFRKPFSEKPADIEKINVSYKARVLQFYVESFHFNEVGNQEFRYFLKGFEDDYGQWTSATTKEYTNLREGDYTFFVQARNDLGEVVTSLPLSLHVKPPFHRSLFAWVLYIVLGLSALLLISMLQKRRYNWKAQETEKAKQAELAKKQQQLVEMEKQKEQQLLQLEEDKMQSELRHLNNLLAASTMNLVVKNDYIETIKLKLKEVNKKGSNRETRQALENIVKEIDTTLKLQEDWEQFEYHFDQVHGDFLSRLRDEFFDLTPNEQKLCAFLRLNLNTKDISNLMGISLRGVEVARYRLRKKLNLDQGQNLSKFILEF